MLCSTPTPQGEHPAAGVLTSASPVCLGTGLQLAQSSPQAQHEGSGTLPPQPSRNSTPSCPISHPWRSTWSVLEGSLTPFLLLSPSCASLQGGCFMERCNGVRAEPSPKPQHRDLSTRLWSSFSLSVLLAQAHFSQAVQHISVQTFCQHSALAAEALFKSPARFLALPLLVPSPMQSGFSCEHSAATPSPSNAPWPPAQLLKAPGKLGCCVPCWLCQGCELTFVAKCLHQARAGAQLGICPMLGPSSGGR